MYQASRDEPLILHEVQRIFGESEWVGDLNRVAQEKATNVQLFKQVLVYTQATLGKIGVTSSLYYLLVPLISVFRNYQFEERLQYLTCMFKTLLQQVHQQIVQESHPEEIDFVTEFATLREAYLQAVERLDAELGEKFRTQLLSPEAAIDDP